MSKLFDCPNCGAPVTFQSSVSVFVVCAHCQSMVVRHDVNVETLGKMAELLPDLNPIQIGTRGEFEGQAFTIIGRVRLAYEEGSWSEWFAQFGDGRHGWIGQAQGFFMIGFEVPAAPTFKSSDLAFGKILKLQDFPFRIVDHKNTVCLGGEGELPFAATPGRKARSVDLTSIQDRCATIEISDEGTRMFVGKYARFDDLKFTELRNVPGWSNEFVEPERNQTTALNCPQCGAEVRLKAAGFVMSAACQRCGTLIDTATPDLQIIRRAQQAKRIDPLIPIGKRGKLFDVNYEVIGFQHVDDGWGGWNEYLLFNPWQGFVWLVTYQGHWSFVRRLFEVPRTKVEDLTGPAKQAEFEGKTYRLFAQGRISTTFVLGEFYWKVAIGMKTDVSDFVCPPQILSRESYPQLGEETWSQGEYVEPEVVQAAFGLDPLREPTGIYLNQPNPYRTNNRQLKWIVGLAVLLLILIQLVSVSRSANQKVFEGSFNYQTGTTNAGVTTESFEIAGGSQALEVALNAPVNNNWVEVGVDLVSDDTKQVVATFDQGVEYYNGYDDGAWSEGSQTEHRLLSAIPPGKYHLLIDTSADPAVQTMPVNITVMRDVPLWANFWIALSMVLAYPIYRGIRAHAFERARWMDSDYSPYMSFESDDD